MLARLRRFEHKKKWILGPEYYTSQQEHAIRMSDTAVYSATEASIASLICDTIAGYVDAPAATITDGTACMGSNVIPFARAFKRVNAVEIDRQQCSDLQYNVRAVPGCDNVYVYNMDIVGACALHSLHHDVLYLDPPWGGHHYRDTSKLALFLSGTSLADACELWARKSRFIALKLPVNVNFEKFRRGHAARPYREVFVRSIGYDSTEHACVLPEHAALDKTHQPIMVLMILQSRASVVGVKRCVCIPHRA